MKIFIKKKIIYCLIVALTLSCILIIPSKCYAKTSKKMTIGKEISNKSLDTDSQYYELTLKNKMKVKISIIVDPVEEQSSEETVEDYYDEYDEYDEDSNTIDVSMENEYYETVFDEYEIIADDTRTTTIVLDAGTYTICVFGHSEGLKYTIKTEDKTTYTKKISMISKLSLVTGDSKKITVKSSEKGKSIGEVIWTTSNKKVAKVDSSGNITGMKQGTCFISAKTKNAKTVKCKVKIIARPQLYITETSFDINFLGGVEPYITMQNNFGKTIKYIYFNCYFYNALGDPAYCSIQNTNYQRLRITGPIKNGLTNTYYWGAVIYNNSTGKMYIKSTDIEFMDGTKKTVSIKKSYK